MEDGILHLHNLMRWVVLLFLVLTLITGLGGMNGRKEFTGRERRMVLFLMVSADLQLLLGLSLYFLRGWLRILTQGGEIMSNPAIRFWTIEHMAGMLIGLVFIHLAYNATKKKVEDGVKFRKMFWFALVALIIILVTIPWPFRELIGRPWLPGIA